jgi:hypothetical protein
MADRIIPAPFRNRSAGKKLSPVPAPPKGSPEYDAHRLLFALHHRLNESTNPPRHWMKIGSEYEMTEEQVSECITFALERGWIERCEGQQYWVTLTEEGMIIQQRIDPDLYPASFRLSGSALFVARVVTELSLNRRDFTEEVDVRDGFTNFQLPDHDRPYRDVVTELMSCMAFMVHGPDFFEFKYFSTKFANQLRTEMMSEITQGRPTVLEMQQEREAVPRFCASEIMMHVAEELETDHQPSSAIPLPSDKEANVPPQENLSSSVELLPHKRSRLSWVIGLGSASIVWSGMLLHSQDWFRLDRMSIVNNLASSVYEFTGVIILGGWAAFFYVKRTRN